MREILFRGRFIGSKFWTYGYPLIFPDGDTYIMEYLGEDDLFEKIKIQNSTLSQFTGVYDKNGKMIFEGDIVKGEQSNYPGGKLITVVDKVEYKGTCFMWGSYTLGGYMYPEYLEVIGNIYDNLELLEEN